MDTHIDIHKPLDEDDAPLSARLRGEPAGPPPLRRDHPAEPLALEAGTPLPRSQLADPHSPRPPRRRRGLLLGCSVLVLAGVGAAAFLVSPYNTIYPLPGLTRQLHQAMQAHGIDFMTNARPSVMAPAADLARVQLPPVPPPTVRNRYTSPSHDQQMRELLALHPGATAFAQEQAAAAARTVKDPLGLIAAKPLTAAVVPAPVAADVPDAPPLELPMLPVAAASATPPATTGVGSKRVVPPAWIREATRPMEVVSEPGSAQALAASSAMTVRLSLPAVTAPNGPEMAFIPGRNMHAEGGLSAAAEGASISLPGGSTTPAMPNDGIMSSPTTGAITPASPAGAIVPASPTGAAEPDAAGTSPLTPVPIDRGASVPDFGSNLSATLASLPPVALRNEAAPPPANASDAEASLRALRATSMTNADQTVVLEQVTQLAKMVGDLRTSNNQLRADLRRETTETNTRLDDYGRRLALSEARRAMALAMQDGPTTAAAADAQDGVAQISPNAPTPATAPVARQASYVVPASGKGAVTANAGVSHRYRVQAASPGLAMLSEVDRGGGDGAQLQVSVGQVLGDMGRVKSIGQRGTTWVVVTENGNIE